MLPLLGVPKATCVHCYRIQSALHVPQPEPADHAQRTGENTASSFPTENNQRVIAAESLLFDAIIVFPGSSSHT